MRWNLCSRICLLLAFHLATAFAQHEQFDEDLHLRPLRDGRLLSRFSFTTLLKGTAPRDPQQLSADDEGMCSTCIPHLLDFSFTRQRSITHFFPLLSVKYSVNMRLPSFISP